MKITGKQLLGIHIAVLLLSIAMIVLLNDSHVIAGTRTIDDGVYYIKSMCSGKFMGIENNAAGNGGNVFQYAFHGEKINNGK